MGVTANGVTYHFTITKPGFDPDLLKALVVMASRETDLIFSRARRKLETEFRLWANKPICAVDGGTECGEHLAKLLSGFLIQQVGEEGFRVDRLPGDGKEAV